MVVEVNGIEIERKFLLDEPPAAIRETHGIAIRQGYLAFEETREIRIRRKNGLCLLTVKEGAGIGRREIEVRISPDQFEALWPLTEGRDLTKTRYEIEYQGHTLEIDVFDGHLAPLCMGEVEFPDQKSCERFRKPPFFGEEVTHLPEFRNINLATHGIPDRSRRGLRIGALPYEMRGDQLYVVVITNRSGSKWIVPKGQPEVGMTRPDVAIMEAVEESGAVGALISSVQSRCTLKGGDRLVVYPLKISKLLKRWPESSFRRRSLVPIPRALRLITEKPLRDCVSRLAEKILGSHP